MWRWFFFSVSACCVSILNLGLPSSSETGVYPGIRSWKMHLSEWARSQKSIMESISRRKWRAETLQPGLDFDNFNTHQLEKALVTELFVFLGLIVIFWKWESRPSKWHQFRLLTLNFFFVCLAWRHGCLKYEKVELPYDSLHRMKMFNFFQHIWAFFLLRYIRGRTFRFTLLAVIQDSA
jgi:hypothetical protein